MNKRYLLLAFVLAASTGCESLWMNQGKLVSVLAAGQVGMFRRQMGQWPQSKSQLVEHGCPELDDSTFDDAVIEGPGMPVIDGCQFFVKLEYQIELQPHAPDLRMVLRDPAGKLVCDLLVIVPPNDGRDMLSPQIRMKTMWWRCPGEGEAW
jgi:hypothetical protein